VTPVGIRLFIILGPNAKSFHMKKYIRLSHRIAKVLVLPLLFLIHVSTWAQDTTSVRLIGCTAVGEIMFFDQDTFDFITVPTTFSVAHAIFTNPADGKFYGLMQEVDNTNRSFYVLNPFSGSTLLAYDCGAGSAFAAAEVTPTGRVFAIQGNAATVPGTIVEVDVVNQSSTPVAVSNVPDGEPRGIGYNPLTNQLWVFSSFVDEIYTMVLDTWAQSTVISIMPGEVHGAFYKNDVFYLSNYGGDVMRINLATSNDPTVINTSNESLMDLAEIDLVNSPDTSFCPGDSVAINAQFVSNSYGWIKDGVILAGETNDTLWVSQAGTYELISEIGNFGTNYMRSEPVNIIAGTIPVVTLTAPDTIICTGDSVLLTGTSGGSLQWYLNGNPIIGATTNTHYATTGGNYNMIKTNLSGCSDSADNNVTVIELASPVVSISASDSIICPGDSVLLTGNPNENNQWYLNGNIIAGATSNTYYTTTPGVYNMTSTNANSCTDSADAGVVLVAGTLQDCTAGIEDDMNTHFQLFPNPADDHVYIQDMVQPVEQILIYDCNGKTVMTVKNITTNNNLLNINSLSPGMYLVSFFTEDGSRITRRIIKK
jgi:hypothetical protein